MYSPSILPSYLQIGDTQLYDAQKDVNIQVKGGGVVMVKIGAGWETLQQYLDKNDPCRSKKTL